MRSRTKTVIGQKGPTPFLSESKGGKSGKQVKPFETSDKKKKK